MPHRPPEPSTVPHRPPDVAEPDACDRWSIQLRYLGGWRPWSAFITYGIAKLGEAGSTTYSSRSPEASLRKALKTIAKLAPNDHPDRIVIEVEVDRGWC